MWFWKRKKLIKYEPEKQIEVFNSSVWVDLINKMTEEKKPFKFEEPQTIAKERLEQGAKDFGYARGIKCYNEHKSKVQNQWINPMQSINTGFGSAQYSYYNYQNVNYYECYALAQDPLMNKIFDILAKTPFMQGGEIVSDFSDEDKEVLRKGLDRYQVRKNAEDAVRSSFVCGGCLLYMDFGLDNLEEPLNLKRQDMRQFKGFRHIDPINLVAVDVNTVNPSASDYMEPNIWYVVGLGNVHKSHFLKFEENMPEKIMRPLSMYFGMPLTLLIKQDVANSNLASQGLANLMNRFRTMYLSTDSSNFTGAGAQNFRQRLEVMSLVQDNFSIYPIKDTEQIQQFVTSLSGMNDNVELFYQIISAKTDITMSILMGKGASGLSGTLEGERKNFYDRIRRVQENIKSNLIKMYGIVYGKMTDGKFYNFSDYVFEPLEQATETEKAENLRSYVEVARSLVELGGKAEDVMDWLKQYKDFQLDNVDFDTDTADLQDYEDSQEQEAKSQNEWNEEEHPRDEQGKFTDKGVNFESDFDNLKIGSMIKYPLKGEIVPVMFLGADVSRAEFITPEGNVEISTQSLKNKIEKVKDKELTKDKDYFDDEKKQNAISKYEEKKKQEEEWRREWKQRESVYKTKTYREEVTKKEQKRLEDGDLDKIKYSKKEQENIAKYGIPFSKPKGNLSSADQNLKDAFYIAEKESVKKEDGEIRNKLKEYINNKRQDENYVSSEAENKGISEKEWLNTFGLSEIPTQQDIMQDKFINGVGSDFDRANTLYYTAYEKYRKDVENKLNSIFPSDKYLVGRVDSKQSSSTYYVVSDKGTDEQLKMRLGDHKKTDSARQHGANDFEYAFGENLENIEKEIKGFFK